ncbi:MAG: PKD domain-containing protein, partial [Bacteroidota bacterium]
MCSKFNSTPANPLSQRLLDIQNSTFNIKLADNCPYLSWDVDNTGNSILILSAGSTIYFGGSFTTSTMRAGCGLHYNDVNFIAGTGSLLLCNDTIRDVTFSYDGYILGQNNILNNVLIKGNGTIGDTTSYLCNLPLSPTYSNTNNRFDTVNIYHQGRVYGNHNLFHDLWFSTHAYYGGCDYPGNFQDGMIFGSNDTIFNTLLFDREGTISGTQNDINICTFLCDGWVKNGSNKFDTINFNRLWQNCSSCYNTTYRADTLFLQDNCTQTITGALNLIGTIHCEHAYIKSTLANHTANLFSIPVISLYYVGIKDINASNSYSVNDTAKVSFNMGGNFNWIFNNIYQNISVDSSITSNVHPCFDNTNGVATIFAHGGVGSLQYGLWYTNYTYPCSNPGFGNTSTFYNLGEGSFHVRIVDSLGCFTDGSVTIGGPTQVVVNSVDVVNNSCFQSCDGKLIVHASGGTGHLHYSLNSNFIPSQDTNVFSNLCVGNYTVYVRDDSLCSNHSNVYNISEPDELNLSPSQPPNTILCAGDSTGICIFKVDGGTLPYQITIFPSLTSYEYDTITINVTQFNFIQPTHSSFKDTILLHAGQYSCFVTDVNGCSYITYFHISEPDSIEITFSNTNNHCYGDSSGLISAIVAKGTPPYHYLWTPGNDTTASISNLTSGVYSLQITDANGCVYQKNDTVKSPPQINFHLIQHSVHCFGQSNGGATVSPPTGGTGSYNYIWSTGDSSASIENKPIGMYYVTVTDGSGCHVSDSITILQPPPLSIVTIIDSVSCFGGSNGKAIVLLTGGTLPYTYSWWVTNISNVISTTDSIIKPSGDYNLTISYPNGCDTNIVVHIFQPPPIQTGFLLGNSDCSGTTGGWTQVLVSGGTPPYSFQWNGGSIGGGQSTDSIYSLTPGTYSVTITDNNLCSKIDTVVISSLSAHLQTNNGCAGANNGTATVTPIGGSTPYTYIWFNISLQTNIGIDSIVGNLAPGLYWVRVTDHLGCTYTDTIEIFSVSTLTDSINTLDVSCFGLSNGWAKAYPYGGASSFYFYSWYPHLALHDTTLHEYTSLISGYYYLTITDANGCIKKDTIFIDQPPILGLNIDSANINCNYGDSTGWIKAIASGGTQPYSYLWDPAVITHNSINDSIFNLPVGVYIVTVTDSNSCQITDTIKMTTPSITFHHGNISCYGDSTGWIKAIASGGTMPYIYSWSPGLFPSTDSIFNLAAGTYFLTLTDNFGCIHIDSVKITQSPQLNIAFTFGDNKCHGDSTGWIQANVTGGTKFSNNTYHYLWNVNSHDSISAKIDTLIAGTYTLTVTDSLGCIKTDSFTIHQPLILQDTIHSDSVSCFGYNDGWARVIPSGGTIPYFYSWSPTSVSPSAAVDTIYNLSPITYYVLVTDGNNCQIRDTITIFQPADITLQLHADSLHCFGDSSGVANVVASGGTPPYQYQWNDITHSTNDSIFNLSAGYFRVTVTDGNGCHKTDSILVKQPNKLTIIKDSLNVTCHDSLSGFAKVTVSGGTPPYSYHWNNGGTLNIISGIPAGNYWVIVKDAHQCVTDTVYFHITQPQIIHFVAAPDTLICYNTQALLRIDSLSGGVPPWLVNWNPPNPTTYSAVLTRLTGNLTVTTKYFATIKDSNGCLMKDSLTVTVNPQILVNAGIDRSICKKDTIHLLAVASGGTPGYTYLWSPGTGLSNINIANPIASDTVTTTYVVTVTDSHNCSANDNVIITVKPLPVPLFKYDTVCFGNSTHFTNLTVPPPPISSYLWNFGDLNTSPNYSPTHLYNSPGFFNVSLIAYATNGCKDTVIHQVLVDSLPTPNFTFTNACLGQTTYFTNTSTPGGNGSCTYLWDLGDGTQSVAQNPFHFYAYANNYQVKLIVINNLTHCTNSIIKTVAVRALPIAAFSSDSACYGDSLHLINLSTSAGSLINYSNWNFGDGSPNSTLWNPVHFYDAAGIYYITLFVKDTNGCIGTVTKQQIISPAPFADFVYSQTCFGDTMHFTDISNYTFYSINSWKWKFGDGDSSTLQNPSHFYNQPGIYHVSLKVINTNLCYDSTNITVIVDSLPVANFIVDTVCWHNETHFTDSSLAFGSPNYDWQWTFGDGDSAFYQNPIHTYPDSLSYQAQLIVTNIMGCKDTLSKTVFLHKLPIANFSFIGTCLHDSTQFTSTSTSENGSTIQTYLWEFGDGYSSNVQNPYHVFALSGSYHVRLTITNSNGCIDDTAITVTINPLPDVNFAFSQTCLNSIMYFTDLSNGNGVSLISWKWNFGINDTSIIQNPNFLFDSAGAHAVSLKVTDFLGCFASLTKNVFVDSLPLANFTSDEVCLHNETHFTDLSESHGTPNNVWQWAFWDGDSSFVQNPFHTFPNQSPALDSARLIVTNQMGCKDTIVKAVIIDSLPFANFSYIHTCLFDNTLFTSISVSHSVPDVLTYYWEFGDGDLSFVQNPTHSYLLSGSYNVRLTIINSNDCIDDTSITVTINPLPDVNFDYIQTCFHDSTHFIDLSMGNGVPITNWFWDFGNGDSSIVQFPNFLFSSAGFHSVSLTVTDINGCFDISTKTISVDFLPVADFTSDAVCLHNETHFIDLSESHGTPNNVWQWTFWDGDSSFVQNPLHTFPNQSPAIDSARLIVTNLMGCKDTIVKPVIIDSLPVANFTYIDTCLNDITHFTSYSISHSIPDALSYYWEFGDGTTSILQNPPHIYSLSGEYHVELTVTNSNGCSHDTTITITINPLPDPNFSYSQTCFGDSTCFTDLSVGNGALLSSWVWDFGGGHTSVSQNPCWTFSPAGLHNIILVVYDAYQCHNSITLPIMIDYLPVANFKSDTVCLHNETHFIDLSESHGT